MAVQRFANEVHKFGGGILNSKADYARAARLTRRFMPHAIVMSAAKGVTSELIGSKKEDAKQIEGLIDLAKEGKNYLHKLDAMAARHYELTNNHKADGEIAAGFRELKVKLDSVSRKGSYDERDYAWVASRGEYLSCLVMKTHLPQYGFWPAENGIGAKGSYTHAMADVKRTTAPPQGSIVPGFYGMNAKGEVCVFDRGGSDLTNSLVAAAIGAKRAVFWKDVPGFLTADPRSVPHARMISMAHPSHISELARMGASVLHPNVFLPLRERDVDNEVEVEIRGVNRPSSRGTVITPNANIKEITGVAGKKRQAVVMVSGEGLVGVSGVAADILSRVARAGVPVDVIATSQASLSMSIDEKNLSKVRQVLQALEDQGYEVSGRGNLAMVGIVGHGVKESPLLLSRVFAALDKHSIKPEMHSQGASGLGFSFLVPTEQYEAALRAAHDAVFPQRKRRASAAM